MNGKLRPSEVRLAARRPLVIVPRRAARARRGGFGNAFALLCLACLLAAGAAQAADPPPLDVNRATAEQLEALPGIGAVKAAAILAVREERGGFRSLAELESVRGIGPKLAAKLRPMLTIGVRKPSARKGAAAARTTKSARADAEKAGR